MSDKTTKPKEWDDVCARMVGRTITAIEPGHRKMEPTVITFDTGDRLVIDWAGGWEWYGFEWLLPGEKARWE